MTGELDILIKLPTLNQRKDVIEEILTYGNFSKDEINYILKSGFQIAIKNKIVNMVDFYLGKIDSIDPHSDLISAYYIYISSGDSTIYKQIVQSKKYDQIPIASFFQSQYPEILAVYGSIEEIYLFIKLLESKNMQYYYKSIMHNIINGAIMGKPSEFVIKLLKLNNNETDDNILYQVILNGKFTVLFYLLENGYVNTIKIKTTLHLIYHTINMFHVQKESLILGYEILKTYL